MIKDLLFLPSSLPPDTVGGTWESGGYCDSGNDPNTHENKFILVKAITTSETILHTHTHTHVDSPFSWSFPLRSSPMFFSLKGQLRMLPFGGRTVIQRCRFLLEIDSASSNLFTLT